MPWSWQQPDWKFAYDPARLRSQEERFRHGAGVVARMIAHLGKEDRESFTVSLIAQKAIDSWAIEGEVLDRASVQSSVAKHFGLQDAATATAARDLAELVELGALRKEGVLKHTRYYLVLEDRRRRWGLSPTLLAG